MIRGFSTGALAKNDFQLAVDLLNQSTANAIELSALREEEVESLVNGVNLLNLDKYEYISFHAPSKLKYMKENELLDLLEPIVQKGWQIIVHPDIIMNYSSWERMGNCLCIENMDKRKKIGRTVFDLDEIFLRLPNATFCFDIAHARQVDPTMTQAYCIINKFADKLKQIHISSVNTQSRHEPLNFEALLAFKRISNFIPENVPIILESPVTADKIEHEMDLATSILYMKSNNKKNSILETVFNGNEVKNSW